MTVFCELSEMALTEVRISEFGEELMHEDVDKEHQVGGDVLHHEVHDKLHGGRDDGVDEAPIGCVMSKTKAITAEKSP